MEGWRASLPDMTRHVCLWRIGEHGGDLGEEVGWYRHITLIDHRDDRYVGAIAWRTMLDKGSGLG